MVTQASTDLINCFGLGQLVLLLAFVFVSNILCKQLVFESAFLLAILFFCENKIKYKNIIMIIIIIIIIIIRSKMLSFKVGQGIALVFNLDHTTFKANCTTSILNWKTGCFSTPRPPTASLTVEILEQDVLGPP